MSLYAQDSLHYAGRLKIMNLRRVIPLAFWLSTILLMAAGMLVPAPASAHPGHGEGSGSRQPIAFPASAVSSALDIDELRASGLQDIGRLRGDDRAILFEQSTAEGTCGGAVCCGNGHGCCSAYLVGGVDPPSPPVASRVLALLTGLRLGLGATAIPEPPRPAR